MSTLHANTVETSSGGTVTLTKQSAAKAYCGCAATDGNGISDSLNVSSQSDNGTGDYDYTVTNAFAAQMDNGAIVGMAGQHFRIIRVGATDTTTTVFDSKLHNSNDGSAVDTSHHWAVHGDLA